MWLWTALGALLLLALAAGAIVALAASDEEEPDAALGVSSVGPTGTTSTIPPPPTTGTLTNETTLTIPPPTTTTLPTTTAQTTTTLPTTSTQPTTTNDDDIIDWPTGTDGYSVFLRSTPIERGTRARRRGCEGRDRCRAAGGRRAELLELRQLEPRLLRHLHGCLHDGRTGPGGPAERPEQGLPHGLRAPRRRTRPFEADFVTLVRGMLDCRVGAVRGALLTRC